MSNGVYALHANTAGGRVRFKTDSPYVAIHSVDGCHPNDLGFMSMAKAIGDILQKII